MSKFTESRLKLYDWIIGYDYFISYSHKDKLNYPAKLKQELEDQGFKVCLDQQDFHAGQQLSSLTKRRLRASRNLIVLARPNAISVSKWVPKEVSLFLERQSDNSKGPITIDINNSIEKALEDDKNTLAKLLNTKDWLRVEENISDLDGDPSKSAVDEITHSHKGIRAQQKQLRIQSTAIFALFLLSTLFGIAAWSSNRNATTAHNNAITAQAEGLAATALTEATTKDPRVGFAGSALAKAADALAQRSTVGTRRSAARVLQDIPAKLEYSSNKSKALGDIAIAHDGVYATEGSAKLNVYSLDDLSLINTETPESLGIDFIGNVASTPNGVVVTGRLNGVWIEGAQRSHFKIPGWVNKINYHSQTEKLVYSNLQDGIYWLTKEMVQHSAPPGACKPPNGFPLRGYALGEDNTVVLVTQSGSRKVDIHRVDINTCHSETFIQLDNTGFYDIIRVGEETIIRTTEQIVVLNANLQIKQLLHDPGVTVWMPISVTEYNTNARGFMTTQGNGHFKLYTQTNDGRFSLTEESNTLVPGQIEDLARHSSTNDILMSARAGHFVSSDLPGVLARVPLTLRTYNGIHSIHFRDYEPAVTLQSFNSNVIHTAKINQSIFSGLSDGSVYRTNSGGDTTKISGSDQANNRPDYSLLALAASQHDVFSARKTSDSEFALFTINGNTETQLITLSKSVESMAATNDVVFYRTDEEFFFLDLKTDTNTKFEVDGFNGNPSQKTMVVSPDGEWIVLGLFNGFDIRRTSAIKQVEQCVVTPFENAAGVVSAFSTDSQFLVLGTWEGQLSLWKQESSCWTRIHDFVTERGTMIPTVAFIDDNKTIIGNRLQSTSRLQLWDVATGDEIGTDYPTSARAIIPSAEGALVLVRERDVAVIDTSVEHLIARLCEIASNVVEAGLLGDGEHVCS